MKITISPNVAHDCRAAILFAYQFAQARAKKLGKTFRCHSTTVTATRTCGHRGYRGRAWSFQGRVLLRLASKLPAHQHKYARYQGMPCFDLAGGSESVVYLAAHEFGHILGWPGDKAGETSCCKFGYEAVEAWREQQYQHPACLI